jgi:hypothetical protein
MIVAGTGPLIHIDLGKDRPGMTLQRQDREGGIYIWINFMRYLLQLVNRYLLAWLEPLSGREVVGFLFADLYG